MKTKEWLIGVGVGFVLGLLVGVLAARLVFRGEEYAVQIMAGGRALRLNKRTGETWEYDYREDDKAWKPVPVSK